MARKTELDVFEKESRQLKGQVSRTIFNQRSFGNWGAGTVSVLGSRYDVVGRNIYLPKVVINKLKSKGEFKLI